MVREPSVKRTIAFIDGQNLFFAAKEAFGYSYPDYETCLSPDDYRPNRPRRDK